MIVTLDFPTLHIRPVDGSDDGLWLDSMDHFEPVESTDTEYRPTAAGSMRAFVPTSVRRTFSVSCTSAPTREARWVKDHRNVHCLFRFDDWRFFGMYERVRAIPYPVGDLYQLEFMITEVTHPEAV